MRSKDIVRTALRRLVATLLLLALIAVVVALSQSPAPLAVELIDRIVRASTVELLSLDPRSLTERNRRQRLEAEFDHTPLPLPLTVSPADLFHDHQVLGRITLQGVEVREFEVAFERAVRASDGGVALCFEPRHGVRFVSDGRQYDLLICFQCHQLYIFRPFDVSGTRVLIGSAADGFNALLSRHGIALPAN